VLQADGGTRTAAVCGAYVALADALAKLPAQMPGAPAGLRPKPGQFNAGGEGDEPPPLAPRYDPSFYQPQAALVDQLAAVSVGVVDGEVRLDLDYKDDAAAHVDMNVAYTAGGRFVEVQGSAEKLGGFDRATMDRMLDLAVKGCTQLMVLQRQALAPS
jgi:ribonuclease PH